jgi:hypothetical protein
VQPSTESDNWTVADAAAYFSLLMQQVRERVLFLFERTAKMAADTRTLQDKFNHLSELVVQLKESREHLQQQLAEGGGANQHESEALGNQIDALSAALEDTLAGQVEQPQPQQPQPQQSQPQAAPQQKLSPQQAAAQKSRQQR